MMLHSALEPYRAADSLIHRLDPRLKLSAALALVLVTTSLPPAAWAALLLAGLVTVAVAGAARVPLSAALRRSLAVLPLVGLAALSILFARQGRVLWSMRLGRWMPAITDAGVIAWVTIVIKAWLAVLVSGLLVATTPFPALLQAMRALHVPGILITILSFMYRYLFVLVDEAARLQIARLARSAGGAGAGGTAFWRARVLGGMIGSLFIRGYERSERTYHAMLSRGYDGQWPALEQAKWQGRDTWAGLVLGVSLAAVVALGYLV